MSDRHDAPLRAADLRQAMEMVTEGYLRFLRAGPDPTTGDDTKAFAAHHAACRAALAHLEHLIKLARAAGDPLADVEAAEAVLAEAREAIAQLDEREVDGATDSA